MKMMSTARSNFSTWNSSVAGSRNFIKFRLARLQAELSTCRYSEQGLLALIRPLAGHVCQSFIVVS